MSDFWIQGSNGKKEKLNNSKHGIRKEQVDEKFHNLFDAYDVNKDGTLEQEELEIINKGLMNFAGSDKTLDANENAQLTSIFAKEVGIENADFMGFVKSVSDASEDIVESTEKQTEDGSFEITTKYNGGVTETIAYYPNGDFKWKKTEKQFSKTVYEIVINGQRQEVTEEQYKKALAELEKRTKNPQKPSVVRGLENDLLSISINPTIPNMTIRSFTNQWEEHEEQFSSRFIAEELGINIDTDDGKKILERLSYFPKEVLAQIKENSQEIKELITSNELEPTFDNLSNLLEIVYGLTLRDEDELKASEPQRAKIINQIKVAQLMANIYETCAQWNDQYTDNLGLFGLGSEGCGYLLNKMGDGLSFLGIDLPTSVVGENHYQWADSCREFAERAASLKVLNPEKFNEGFKNMYGDKSNKWGIDYDEQAFKKMFELAETGKAQNAEGELTDEYKEAILKAMNFVADNPNDSLYNSVMNGFGEALIMLMTLGWAAEAKGGEVLATSTMSTFSRAGVAIASKGVNSKLLQGVLRFTGNGVKLLGPAINEGTKMYTYTALTGTISNLSNRTIKFNSEENSLEKFLQTEGMVLEGAKGSFAFGAFAGVFGSTVTQKVMQYVSKVSSKVTTALSEKFAQGAVDANEVFVTILEKSAPTKMAEAAAFVVDVVGFTAFETANTLVNHMEGFPDKISTEDVVNLLWEEFKGQGWNLGQIKVVSHLIMWMNGSRSARMQSQKYLKENLPQLKGITIEQDGEGYKINLANGRQVQCKNTTEMISACHLIVRNETALSKVFADENVKKKADVQQFTAPMGRTDAEDLAIERAKEENPAEVVTEKIKDKWLQSGLEEAEPEEEASPLIISQNGRAVLDTEVIDRYNETYELPAIDEVSKLIFTGKLNENLTQRYDRMKVVFDEIIAKHNSEFVELAQTHKNNPQAFAESIIKILSKELGMEGFEPPVDFSADNNASAYMDYENGKIRLNPNLVSAKNLVTMISHEYIHLLQLRDVIAQYGEQGLKDIILNDNSVVDKEATLQKTLKNPYIRHLIDDYNFEKAETGSVNDYIRRIYRDEFIDTKTEGEEYANQAIEREAYHNQLDETEGLEYQVVERELSPEEIRIKRQQGTVCKLNDGTEFIINDDSTITFLTPRKIPAGKIRVAYDTIKGVYKMMKEKESLQVKTEDVQLSYHIAKLYDGTASADIVKEAKEYLARFFTNTNESLDCLDNISQQDLAAKLKLMKYVEQKYFNDNEYRSSYFTETLTPENYVKILQFFGELDPEQNQITQLIKDVDAKNIEQYEQKLKNPPVSRFQKCEWLYLVASGKDAPLEVLQSVLSSSDLGVVQEKMQGFQDYIANLSVNTDVVTRVAEEIEKYRTGNLRYEILSKVNENNAQMIIDICKNEYEKDPDERYHTGEKIGTKMLKAATVLENADAKFIAENYETLYAIFTEELDIIPKPENIELCKLAVKSDNLSPSQIKQIFDEIAPFDKAKAETMLKRELSVEQANYLETLSPEALAIEEKILAVNELYSSGETSFTEKEQIKRQNILIRMERLLKSKTDWREELKQEIMSILENAVNFEELTAKTEFIKLFNSDRSLGYHSSDFVKLLKDIKIAEQVDLYQKFASDEDSHYIPLNSSIVTRRFGQTYCESNNMEGFDTSIQGRSKKDLYSLLPYIEDKEFFRQLWNDTELSISEIYTILTHSDSKNLYQSYKISPDYSKDADVFLECDLRSFLKKQPDFKFNPELTVRENYLEFKKSAILGKLKEIRTASRVHSFESGIFCNITSTIPEAPVEKLLGYSNETIDRIVDALSQAKDYTYNDIASVLINEDLSNLDRRGDIKGLLQSNNNYGLYPRFMFCSDKEFNRLISVLEKRPEILSERIDLEEFNRRIEMSDAEYTEFYKSHYKDTATIVDRTKATVQQRPKVTIKPIEIEPFDEYKFRSELARELSQRYEVDLSVCESLNHVSRSFSNLIDGRKVFTYREQPRTESRRTANSALSSEALIKQLEETGRISISIEDNGGAKGVHTDDPVILPEDREYLGIERDADGVIAIADGRTWDNDRFARDLMQNFYDGNGYTLEGVDIEAERLPNGKYRIKVSGKGEFIYERALTYGFSGKSDPTRSAGRHGEGTKILTANLLGNKGAESVIFACGDWKLTLTEGETPEGLAKTRATTPIMKTLTENETPIEGNYLEFQTDDLDLVKSIIKAKDYFYSPSNEDFARGSSTIENDFILVNMLPEGENGNLYVIQRYEVEGVKGLEGTLPGISIAFKRNPDKTPEIIALNNGKIIDIKSGRNRVGITHETITDLITVYAQTLSEQEIVDIIGQMKDVYLDFQGYGENPRYYIFKGFVNAAKKKNISMNFLGQDYIAYSSGISDDTAKLLRTIGKTLVVPCMRDLGIPDASEYMREAESGRTPIVDLTREEQRRIKILDKAVELFSRYLGDEAQNIISAEEAHAPRYIIEPKENDGGWSGEAITSGRKYKAHWVNRHSFNRTGFCSELATWIHEISHKTGGDGEASFNARLETIQGLLIDIAIKYPDFAKQLQILAEEYEKCLNGYGDVGVYNYDYRRSKINNVNENGDLITPLELYSDPLTRVDEVVKLEDENSDYYIHPTKGLSCQSFNLMGRLVINLKGDIGSKQNVTTAERHSAVMDRFVETEDFEETLPAPNGVNPVQGSTQIAERDRAFLNRTVKTNMMLDYNKHQEWSYEMVARDLFQNFYDGHNGTLDGTTLSIKKVDGKYRVRLSGLSQYNYFFLQHIGAGAQDRQARAGGFGEGAKMASRTLLRAKAVDKMTFASGDWTMEFTKQEGVPDEVAYMMRTLKENPEHIDGTYVEFETDNLNLIDAMFAARDYFEHSSNPDFTDLDFENETLGYRVLTPESKGNFYYKQRYAMKDSDELEGSMNGLEIIFKQKLTKEKLAELNIDDDCDRRGFTPAEIEILTQEYARSMSDDELMQAIADCIHFAVGANRDEITSKQGKPEYRFVCGLMEAASNRGLYFKKSKYVQIGHATDKQIEYLVAKGFIPILPDNYIYESAKRVYDNIIRLNSSEANATEARKLSVLQRALEAMGKLYDFDVFTTETDRKQVQLQDGMLKISRKYLENTDFCTLLNDMICATCNADDYGHRYGYNMTDEIAKTIARFTQIPETIDKLKALEQEYNEIKE